MMKGSRRTPSNAVGRIIDKTDAGLHVVDLYTRGFEDSRLVRTKLNASLDVGSFIQERHIDIENVNHCNNCSNKYFYDSDEKEFYCPMCE